MKMELINLGYSILLIPAFMLLLAGCFKCFHKRVVFSKIVPAAIGLSSLLLLLLFSRYSQTGIQELAIFRIDMLVLIMVTMVSILGYILLIFSRRYLDGDAVQASFLSRMAVTISSVFFLLISGNLFLFFIAWVCVSLTLHRLLLIYPDRKAAQAAAKKKFIMARVGDAFLLLAIVLMFNNIGSAQYSVLFEYANKNLIDPTVVGGAAICIALAAIFKAAQFPTHGWLIEVMETPTPVSALLHAGILNAGPFLVLRFSPVLHAQDSSALLLLIFGATTAMFASVVLLTQSAIKTILAYSSVAHMGFMLFLCAIGEYSAATLHLVAHSFYKAHAFLSSGSVVDIARVNKVSMPTRTFKKAPIIGASVVAIIIIALLLLLFIGYNALTSTFLLMAIILTLGLTHLIGPALDIKDRGKSILPIITAATLVGVSFFILEKIAHVLLAGVFPKHSAPSTLIFTASIIVLLLFTLIIALQLLKPNSTSSSLRRQVYVLFKNGFYANAITDNLLAKYAIKSGDK